uniref:Uncharacterized protein n=1 Tax=Anguilla anguilla TaxID=7936 RepID=A0A0E9WNK3_ANGAN
MYTIHKMHTVQESFTHKVIIALKVYILRGTLLYSSKINSYLLLA